MPENMKGTKRKIFDTALTMFAESLYHTVTMRDIAEAVGIKPASIYNHFKSKDELLTIIYEYFDSNMNELMPDLDALMAQVGKRHPHDILWDTNFQYPSDIRVPMAKAILIASSLVRTDPRAAELIYKNLVRAPYNYDPPLLNRMMELDLIEPIDPDTYTLLHSSFCHSTAIRFSVDMLVGDIQWEEGLRLLNSLVKVKGTGLLP